MMAQRRELLASLSVRTRLCVHTCHAGLPWRLDRSPRIWARHHPRRFPWSFWHRSRLPVCCPQNGTEVTVQLEDMTSIDALQVPPGCMHVWDLPSLCGRSSQLAVQSSVSRTREVNITQSARGAAQLWDQEIILL